MDSYSETESPPHAPRTTAGKTMRGCVALACAGAAIMLAAQASAGVPASARAAAPAVSAGAPTSGVPAAAQSEATDSASVQTLEAQVIRQLKARMPVGARIDAIALGCKPPAGAILKSVAPGVSVLNSRGFVVELDAQGRTIVCSATVQAKRPVLAAAHDIAPNREISGADFAVAWVDAFSGAPGAVSDFPSDGTYVAVTSIRAGMPLYRTEFARPLAIHPGDMVTVVVRNGPVLVRTVLEARQGASIGETATMVNPSSGATVNAKVTGVRTAEMVLQ